MESSWFYNWHDEVIKVHFVGEFCKENNFKHLHKLVIKLLGGKLGNAQTWCTTIHEGNLERVHKEDGAKNNIEQNSISNWHSFFIQLYMLEPWKIHLHPTHGKTYLYSKLLSNIWFHATQENQISCWSHHLFMVPNVLPQAWLDPFTCGHLKNWKNCRINPFFVINIFQLFRRFQNCRFFLPCFKTINLPSKRYSPFNVIF